MPSLEHRTLAANVVTNVDVPRVRYLEVTSVDGASPVYYTVDGTTPVIGGAGTRVLPAVPCWDVLELNLPGDVTTISVKLLAAATTKVSVSTAPASDRALGGGGSSSGGGSGSNGSVVVDGDGTTSTRIAGRDRNGVVRPMLTDERGRQKISHAQPDLVSADLTAVGDALIFAMDSLSDAMYFMRGAAHVGFALAFEYSPDTTAVSGKTAAAAPADGNWYAINTKNAGSGTAAANASTGTLTSNSMTSWELSAPAAAAVRARVTALTSGTLTVGAAGSTAARPTQVTAVVSNTPAVTVSSGTVTADLRPVSGEQAETTTLLGASSNYTGTTRDHGTTVNARPSRYRWTYQATAAALGSVAHLILEESIDSTTWRQTQITPVPADGQAHTGEWSFGHFRYWRIRVVNGAVAQTALVVYGLLVRGDGSTADTKANLPIPVTPVAGTSVAISATLTSPSLNLGVNGQWDKVRAFVVCDQAVTVLLDESYDGSTWHTVGTGTALSAGTAIRLEQPALLPYQRLRVVNGATAAATVRAYLNLVTL